MGRKTKILPEIRLRVVEDYLKERISLTKIAIQLDVSISSIERLGT